MTKNVEIPERKRGQPKKWSGELIQRSIYLGVDDLAVLRDGFEKSGEKSFNQWIVTTALDRAHELRAAAYRRT